MIMLVVPPSSSSAVAVGRNAGERTPPSSAPLALLTSFRVSGHEGWETDEQPGDRRNDQCRPRNNRQQDLRGTQEPRPVVGTFEPDPESISTRLSHTTTTAKCTRR